MRDLGVVKAVNIQVNLLLGCDTL